MRVVVVGLGSMGKRRTRLIHKYDESIQIVGVDSNEERRISAQTEYSIVTFANISDAAAAFHIDCAYICTSPLSHSGIISDCLNIGWHVFAELNLVSDGYEANIILAKQKNLVLFMSSTFLYREEIKMIDHLTHQADCKLNYTYHIGQYLPDWHPWENYLEFFVGNKRTNGCREIFAIELPWLSDVFGDIVNIDVLKSKNSKLNIDYDDNFLVLIQHASGHKGTLAVDVISRKAVRNLEVFGENLYLHWNGSPTGLFKYDFELKTDVNIELYNEIDQLENYSSFVVENAYSNEIESFMQAVLHGKKTKYSFEKDIEILKVIDQIEAAHV